MALCRAPPLETSLKGNLQSPQSKTQPLGAWDLNRVVGWGEGGGQLTFPEPSQARYAGGLGFHEGSSLQEEGMQDGVFWG